MILQNDFKRQWAEIGPDAMAAMERVGASGWYILGKEVERFETLLAEFWGAAYAVGVGNGMDAIEIALRGLGLEPGQKVLTTPFSAFATTLAIIRAEGVPVFVDVDDDGNIDLDQCREVIAQDPSLRFLVPVHLYGNTLDLDRLEALKKDFDLIIIEDCAQAIGAKFGGRHVGSVGQAAATSFYPTKNLGTLGDGGALLTDDRHLAALAKALRHYGQSSLYVHDQLGLNSRLDELHAAILADALLPRLSHWTEARRNIAQLYRTGIKNPAIRCLGPNAAADPVWHLFPILVTSGERVAVEQQLRLAEVGIGVHYPHIIPDQAALKLCRHKLPVDLSNARRLAASEITLPIHPFLSRTEVQLVIESLHISSAADAIQEPAKRPIANGQIAS